MGGPTHDHDDVTLEEIVTRIERAEKELAEARSLLSGITDGRSQPRDSQLPPEKNREIGELDPDSGIDLAILNRHRPPQTGDPFQRAITSLFRLAYDDLDEEEAVQECLRRLVHSSVAGNLATFIGFYRFNWSRFLKFKDQYLGATDDPESFHIVRTDPLDPVDATRVKVFLAASGRSPAPLVVELDPAEGDSWRISEVSL